MSHDEGLNTLTGRTRKKDDEHLWRFWNDKALEVTERNSKLRDENAKLRVCLRACDATFDRLGYEPDSLGREAIAAALNTHE